MTIARGAQAKAEALGDLKLYRVPMRVTVAAQAQKQVAMLTQPAAAFNRVYLLDLSQRGTQASPTRSAPFELRARNVAEEGLGVPMPAGMVALFAHGAGRDLYAGEAPIEDLAIGEKVVLPFGDSPEITWTLTRVVGAQNRNEWRVEISNARDTPVQAEVTLPFGIEEKPASATRGERGWILPVDLAANGTSSITYVIR